MKEVFMHQAYLLQVQAENKQECPFIRRSVNIVGNLLKELSLCLGTLQTKKAMQHPVQWLPHPKLNQHHSWCMDFNAQNSYWKIYLKWYLRATSAKQGCNFTWRLKYIFYLVTRNVQIQTMDSDKINNLYYIYTKLFPWMETCLHGMALN